MPERQRAKKPPNDRDNPRPDKGIGGLPGEGVPTDVAPAPEPTKEQQRTAKRLVENWKQLNPGGAPVSEEFVIAALQQGLDAQQIKSIFKSGALGGPQTGPAFSSPELLDYFTANPAEIQQLFEAVKTTKNAPRTYAEYLAGGGDPLTYRSRNQLLQEAVFNIGGSKQAYIGGTTRQRYLDAGLDPLKYHLNEDDFEAQLQAQDQETGAFNAVGLSPLSDDELGVFASTASKMIQSRRARRVAQGDVFSQSELDQDFE